MVMDLKENIVDLEKIIKDTLKFLDSKILTQEEHRDKYKFKKIKTNEDEFSLTLNSFIYCSGCGKEIKPVSNYDNKCEQCGTLNPLFTCPNCFSTRLIYDKKSLVCDLCKTSYNLSICKKCGYINVVVGKFQVCKKCGADISDNTLFEAHNFKYILAIQILIFKNIESLIIDYSKDIFTNQYETLLSDKDYVKKCISDNWHKFNIISQEDIISLIKNHITDTQDIIILLHQTLKILSAKSFLESKLIKLLKNIFLSSGLETVHFNAILSEYYFVFSGNDNFGGISNIPQELLKYYLILGLNEKADIKALKTAYYRLAKKYHPDANMDLSEAEKQAKVAMFRSVQEAYEILLKELS